jgi:ketosteroid isomerase-like protein
MKRIIITASVIVLVLAVAVQAQIPAQPKSGSVEQELIKLENEWAEAWVKSDVAFYNRITTDDFTWTSPWGWVTTKADDLALLKSGDDVITSWVLADMKVRVYGDTAVVIGRDTIREQYKGKDVSGQHRWTHTWVKLAGRWQCVAGYSSEIVQK